MSIPSPLRTASGPRPRTVVVGIQLPDVSDGDFEASLQELERLADTLGLQVVARVTQRRAKLATAAVVGKGKLAALAAFTGGSGVVPTYSAPGSKVAADEDDDDLDLDDEDAEASEDGDAAARANVVLVDHELTPSQLRNLEKATDAEVLDRGMVILSIFQRHARTREARLQVEIARLAYMSPRLREAHAGSERQRGGIGGKGAGETALELDRRKIRDRIAELRQELVHVQQEADTRRNRRLEPDSQTVALVGYTNAGKSSLMRALTGNEVYVADQLFATLDTTVRALKPEAKPRILVSDTVGFIKKLPHDLVASFRSTLAEAKEARLLLHVLDASDPAFREQYQVTQEVLDSIGVGAQGLLILNKSDRMSPEQREALQQEFPENAMLLSAHDPADVAELRQRIIAFFEAQMEEAVFVVPHARSRDVALLHASCRVLEEAYDAEGARVRVRAPSAVIGKLRQEIGNGGTQQP